MVTHVELNDLMFSITSDKHQREIFGTITFSSDAEDNDYAMLELSDMYDDGVDNAYSTYLFTKKKGEFFRNDGMKLKEIVLEHLLELKDSLSKLVESAVLLK